MQTVTFHHKLQFIHCSLPVFSSFVAVEFQPQLIGILFSKVYEEGFILLLSEISLGTVLWYSPLIAVMPAPFDGFFNGPQNACFVSYSK